MMKAVIPDQKSATNEREECLFQGMMKKN